MSVEEKTPSNKSTQQHDATPERPLFHWFSPRGLGQQAEGRGSEEVPTELPLQRSPHLRSSLILAARDISVALLTLLSVGLFAIFVRYFQVTAPAAAKPAPASPTDAAAALLPAPPAEGTEGEPLGLDEGKRLPVAAEREEVTETPKEPTAREAAGRLQQAVELLPVAERLALTVGTPRAAELLKILQEAVARAEEGIRQLESQPGGPPEREMAYMREVEEELRVLNETVTELYNCTHERATEVSRQVEPLPRSTPFPESEMLLQWNTEGSAFLSALKVHMKTLQDACALQSQRASSEQAVLMLERMRGTEINEETLIAACKHLDHIYAARRGRRDAAGDLEQLQVSMILSFKASLSSAVEDSRRRISRTLAMQEQIGNLVKENAAALAESNNGVSLDHEEFEADLALARQQLEKHYEASEELQQSFTFDAVLAANDKIKAAEEKLHKLTLRFQERLQRVRGLSLFIADSMPLLRIRQMDFVDAAKGRAALNLSIIRDMLQRVEKGTAAFASISPEVRRERLCINFNAVEAVISRIRAAEKKAQEAAAQTDKCSEAVRAAINLKDINEALESADRCNNKSSQATTAATIQFLHYNLLVSLEKHMKESMAISSRAAAYAAAVGWPDTRELEDIKCDIQNYQAAARVTLELPDLAVIAAAMRRLATKVEDLAYGAELLLR